MAIVPIIVTAAKVARQVYKHRKSIYAVLTAQDRYISSAFRYGGYGKATSYGVRSGALAGSIAGAFINNASDSPGNAIPKPFHGPTARTPYKTRGRSTTSSYGRYPIGQRAYRKQRCACPSKRQRSRNRF